MKYDYTVLGRYRNKETCEYLIEEIRKRGFTCYNFCELPADPQNPNDPVDKQMDKLENSKNYYQNDYVKKLFEKPLEALKNADTVILLHPAGLSAHMESGIAFGLGKKLIMIGKPAKPEPLYLMFEERYVTIEDFLATIGEKVAAR